MGEYGYMTRRTIPLPNLRIHTADDDYIQDAAASLHEAIKPTVSLVSGRGGTTSTGMQLYNNSRVTVSRASSQGVINVVMDRSQNFSLNISPSVPRTETGAMDVSQIGSAWDELWQSTNGITYQYREVTWDFSNGKDGFGDVQTGTLTKADFGSGSNGIWF